MDGAIVFAHQEQTSAHKEDDAEMKVGTMLQRRWVRAVLIVAAWTVLALFLTSQMYLAYSRREIPIRWERIFLVELIYAYIWAALTPLILWLYRLQSGSVESPFVGGIDLNGDLENTNDRPAIANLNAPPASVAILASLLGASSPTGYVDANGEPVNPANVRYIVDPAIRTNIAGRNILRGNIINTMDLSLNKGFRLPFEGHKLEVRFDFFNVFNHPNFT